MCFCLGTIRKRSKSEYQGVQSARNPTSTVQLLTTETGEQDWQEQPSTVHQTSSDNQILPHVSVKSPLHFLQGSQGCAEAAVLLPAHYWWEEKRILSMTWDPSEQKEQSRSWAALPQDTHVCAPYAKALLWELQHRVFVAAGWAFFLFRAWGMFWIHFNFINPYRDSTSCCRLCA